VKILNPFIAIILLAFCTSFVFAKKSEPFKKGEFKSWAKTPPMGWNSWDCYGPNVVESEVKANADYMAEKLKDYGWEYIVVDIRWYVQNDKAGGYNQNDPIYCMDKYGRLIPAPNKFPSSVDGKGFKPLADYIHSKGLKFGIHLMRGIPVVAVKKNTPVIGTNYRAQDIYSEEMQCTWLNDMYTVDARKPGAQEYYNSLFDMYADWGVDFVKIDNLSRPYHQYEIEMVRQAIDQCGRPIVFSTSPGETSIEAADHIRKNANMWRMVDDVWDTWGHVVNLFNISQNWYPFIAPGTWPDCDMIPLGRISIRGERGPDRMTRLTKDEQYTLMTLFTIFKSPLMFGGDLPSNDDFTTSLLTNKEVLKMHKEGTDVHQLYRSDGKVAITSRNPNTGDVYLALFNISNSNSPVEVSADLKDLGLTGVITVTNIWTGENLGKVSQTISQQLGAHACCLLKLSH
jgi:alpha-galactosidase